MFHSKQLVIIAGVSAVGKTTLIKNIRLSECALLRKQLGIVTTSSWTFINANEILNLDQLDLKHTVVHYDICGRHAQNGNHEHIGKIIERSEHTLVLTLVASHKVMSTRMALRIQSTLRKFTLLKLKIVLRQLNKWLKYRTYFPLYARYGKWFHYLSQWEIAEHLVLDTSMPATKEACPCSLDEIKKILKN